MSGLHSTVALASWNEEAATLGRIIAHTGGKFTDAEKQYWTERLTAALAKDRGVQS